MNLVIESHEGNIYVAYLENSGVREYLSGPGRYPLRFSSLDQVKEFASDIDVNRVWLSYSNAYDEMIGMQSYNNDVKVELFW